MRTRFRPASTLLCLVTATVGLYAADDAPELDPRGIALRVAHHGRSASLVLSEQEFRRWSPRPPKPFKDDDQGDSDRAIALFNGMQQRFRASHENGIVHVREAAQEGKVAPGLQRIVPKGDQADWPALDAVYSRVAPAIKGVSPGGILPGGVDTGCNLKAPVRLRPGAATAEEVLNDIVRQLPSVSWIATYRSDTEEVVSVGLMCSDGSYKRLWIGGAD